MENKGKKIKYNLILGIASEVLTIILGIIVPRLVLTNYGSEVNGLLGSVSQIYAYVALLEAGVGTATVQALYRTVSKNNRDETNAVLAATNRYYHRTGLLYLLAILLFSILYPLTVDTSIPLITIVLVIVFNGLGSVINYFFQAKYFLLLSAEGKNYIKNGLTMFTNVFKNIAKIVLIRAGFDVVFVQAIAMVVSLIQMVYVTWYIKKYYSWIDLTVEPDFASISQSKNVLVHQITGLVFNNTDNITLTYFAGLKMVSVYSMYNMMYGMINTAQVTLAGSVVFVLGQTYHSDRKRFLELYDCYELYYVALSFALYTVMNFFILPFFTLYTAGVNDINYINRYLPYMFSSIALLSCARNAPNNVISFAGHFKQTQYRFMLEAAINLGVSLVAVQFLGIYGVLLGTIVALFYRTNDIILYTSSKLLKRSPWVSYRRLLICIGVFALIQLLNRFWLFEMASYISLFLFAIPYTVLVFLLYFGMASVCDRNTAMIAWNLIQQKTRKRSNT